MPTNIVFYKRQFSIYSLRFHPGKNNKGFFYVWTESESGRGAQDVGSVILKHINFNVSDAVRHLIFWSDSYGGQNGNIRITLIMMYILQNHERLETVTFTLRVSGHSFLPNVSDFVDLECATRHQQRLYLPEDIIQVMKESRRKNKFVVTRVAHSDFVEIGAVEKNIVNRKVSVSGEQKSWLYTREIKLERDHPKRLFMQNVFSSEYKDVSLTKRMIGRPIALFGQKLSPLYIITTSNSCAKTK